MKCKKGRTISSSCVHWNVRYHIDIFFLNSNTLLELKSRESNYLYLNSTLYFNPYCKYEKNHMISSLEL
jgi:hypothetical protein